MSFILCPLVHGFLLWSHTTRWRAETHTWIHITHEVHTPTHTVTCAHTHTQSHVHTHTHSHMHTWKHITHTHKGTHTHSHMGAVTHTHTVTSTPHTGTHTQTDTHTRTHTHRQTHIQEHTHTVTHMHTHTQEKRKAQHTIQGNTKRGTIHRDTHQKCAQHIWHTTGTHIGQKGTNVLHGHRAQTNQTQKGALLTPHYKGLVWHVTRSHHCLIFSWSGTLEESRKFLSCFRHEKKIRRNFSILVRRIFREMISTLFSLIVVDWNGTVNHNIGCDANRPTHVFLWKIYLNAICLYLA